MNKGLDLIQRQQPEFINDFPTGNISIGVTEEELIELEKELKALEIIKNKFKPYCVANCDNGKVRIWLGHDRFIDVLQEEFDLLKEVLLCR